MMKISVTNESGAPVADYRDFKNLQGDLKRMDPDNEMKLLQSFEDHGFFVPFFVWIDRSKNMWTLDGNGRIKVMKKNDIQNESGGYEFPIWIIKAKNKKEAAEKILLISSEFHKKTEMGMEEFAEAYGIDMDWIKTSTAFADSFVMDASLSNTEMDEFFEKTNENNSSGNTDPDFSITLNYVEDEYREVKEGLSKVGKTPESAVYTLLKLDQEQ